MTNETWGRVQQELLKRMGKNNYTTWIEPLKLTQLKNGVASFEVPSQFHGNWVSRNYADQIQNHMNDAGATVERLEFVAEAGPGDFIFVPPFVPHQEINASSDETLECVLMRSGNEAVVVNLDIDAIEAPEGVAWIDPIHRG